MGTANLTDEETQVALVRLPSWKPVNGKLHREYQFPDFVNAFGFMAAVALVAEAAGHHPEWFNVYNQVRIDLATHEANGITHKDVELASRIEAIASKFLT